ncbi:MAG: hypothetical protein N2999_04370, partial [Proteobacteria bacterium]|nr:hypothetical protein [Pseudomonadota bacterium]
YTKNYVVEEKNYCPIFPKITKIIVLPFSEGIKDASGVKKEGDIESFAGEKMANFTENRLKEIGCFQVVTWEEVKSKMEQNGINYDGYDSVKAELIKSLGDLFKAEAVLKGHVLKYVDKIGGKYGISRPASVSLLINLYDTKDGSLIWHGSYKETQISLSENLLNIDLFLKRGFKWLTADELAKFGISEIISKIPGVSNK